MFVQRSFLSIDDGYFFSPSCNSLSCSSVQSDASLAPAFDVDVAVEVDDEDVALEASILPFDRLLYFSIHSSFVLVSSSLHKLFTNIAIVSHRFAPPAGYFFTALARADISSFAHGVAARFLRATASLRLASRRAFSRARCAAFLALALSSRWSLARSTTMARSAAPLFPAVSDSVKEVNSMAFSLSQSVSTSSFISSMLVQVC
mmetsp:Transcript_4129/g.4735  ORF Transcript_4129/g.4735 Transcript_4129/m.4735 type:complete len:204 (+) Transcript_4129:123-734(+)